MSIQAYNSTKRMLKYQRTSLDNGTKKRWHYIIRNTALFWGLLMLISAVTTLATIALTEHWQLSKFPTSEKEANMAAAPIAILSNTTSEMKSYKRLTSKAISRVDNPSNVTFFFKLADSKITSHNYSYLIQEDGLCQQSNPPFLLILVHSTDVNVKRRDAIRNTWGSISKTEKWPNSKVQKTPVKLVFLFGVGRSTEGFNNLHNERILHGDIVQGDFVDTYYNLTRKSIMGLHWASEHCPLVKYILKTDDDMFVHVLNLIRFLQNETQDNADIMYGITRSNKNVIRSGHWAVSKETYPFSKYPTYLSGASYILPGHLAGEIYQLSEYMSYLNIEDVFVTGIVREMIGARIARVEGFAGDYLEKPRPCQFHNDVKISATNVDTSRMYEIWSGLYKPIRNCFFRKRKQNDDKAKIRKNS